jgi:Protein of unknown function (DUF1569)
MHLELQRILVAINTAVEGMSNAELAQHPPGKWSTAEILEHLSLTYSGTTRSLSKSLAAGLTNGGPDTFKQQVGRLVVLTLGHIPAGRKAPEFTVPHGMAAADAVNTIRQNLRSMDEAITRCERRFGPDEKIARHPVLGPFNTRQWRRFHWVHARHHVRQIAKLKAAMQERAATSGA